MKKRKKILTADKKYSSFFEELERKRQEYLAFIESIKELESLPRAEAWLTYVAKNIEESVEQESLVYLRSRGKNCSKQIEHLIECWKDQREFSYRHDTFLGNEPKFWSGRDEQEIYLDSTMLRTAEWCKIGGFEGTWEEISRESYNSIVKYGLDNKKEVSFWLFWILRSDYAIELMPKVLEKSLDAIQLVDYGKKCPWDETLVENDDREIRHHSIEYLIIAASIIFATARLKRPLADNALINSAGKLLLKTQLKDGSWPFYMRVNEQNSETGYVESTAIIVHSIMCLKPKGWENAVQKSKKWLLSKQTAYGYWDDGGHPNIYFLTVLVLDAIALIDEQTKITFSFPLSSKKEIIGIKTTKRKRFSERERLTVWNREFGHSIDRANCPICKNNEISRTNFAMGHKKSLANNGTNDLKNIRPICHNCNSMMGEMNMNEYIKKFSPK